MLEWKFIPIKEFQVSRHKYAVMTTQNHYQANSNNWLSWWSSTAENINDENTLIIHDERVANLYYQEFMGLLQSMGVIAVENVKEDLCLLLTKIQQLIILLRLMKLIENN